MSLTRRLQVGRSPAPIRPHGEQAKPFQPKPLIPATLTRRKIIVGKDGVEKTVSLYNVPPEFPPEIENMPVGKQWWLSYWQILIDGEQSLPDFIPPITTLCTLRETYHKVVSQLQNPSFLATKAAKGLLTIQNQISRNLTALEATFGFTLNTHSIRQYRPSSKEDVPKSSNTIADRKTEESPFYDPLGEALFGDSNVSDDVVTDDTVSDDS